MKGHCESAPVCEKLTIWNFISLIKSICESLKLDQWLLGVKLIHFSYRLKKVSLIKSLGIRDGERKCLNCIPCLPSPPPFPPPSPVSPYNPGRPPALLAKVKNHLKGSGVWKAPNCWKFFVPNVHPVEHLFRRWCPLTNKSKSVRNLEEVLSPTKKIRLHKQAHSLKITGDIHGYGTFWICFFLRCIKSLSNELSTSKASHFSSFDIAINDDCDKLAFSGSEISFIIFCWSLYQIDFPSFFLFERQKSLTSVEIFMVEISITYNIYK